MGAWTAAALLATALTANAAPDVDAVVSYETQQVTASGVTRIERWQERLVRRGDTVWSERVLPAAAPASHEHAADAGHKHFDFDTASRLVQRAADGSLRVRFVDHAHRVVVEVPKAEYGAVGFDGNWEAASAILPPAVAAGMRAAADGWREESANGWAHRVRWSEAKQLPLRLESRRDDGSVRRVVTVSVSPNADKRLPWAGIGAYEQKVYDDFSD